MFDNPGMYCGGTVNGALFVPVGLGGGDGGVLVRTDLDHLALGIREVIFNDVALGA